MAALVFVFKKHATSCILVLLCIAMLVRESNARPPWLAPGSGVFTESAECHTDTGPKAKTTPIYDGARSEDLFTLILNDELLDLCQRCAKLTKSKLAYPACCSTDLEARRWCSDYVYFGSGQYDFH